MSPSPGRWIRLFLLALRTLFFLIVWWFIALACAHAAEPPRPAMTAHEAGGETGARRAIAEAERAAGWMDLDGLIRR